MHHIKSGLRFILSLIFLLAGCNRWATQTESLPIQSPSQTFASEWPTIDWSVSTPDAQGMDSEIIAALLAEIERRNLAFDSFLVIRNGAIISETYFGDDGPDTQHVQYSITKSFASTLVGIALDQELIQRVDQPLSDLLPQYPIADPADLHRQISLEHVLTMTSGLGWSETDAGFRALYQSDDWPGYLLALPVSETPGRKFSYCSGCSHLLMAVIEKATDDGALQFASENLFEPLGINDWGWEGDADGVPIGGWGLRLTPRDMAKLGYLFLRLGEWDGRQIVPGRWVAEATRKHTSTDGTLGYGYQWWIDPDSKGFAALGRDGQMIYVRPEADLIVVTTASGVAHDEIYQLIKSYILPAAGQSH
jgi:CubicO group peptidase (beta-lactamase class C family)